MTFNFYVKDVRGTEVDGSLSGIYCYGNGAFWNPI
ncbi:hypothetical protein ACTGXZ_10310 [Streptococcus suis]